MTTNKKAAPARAAQNTTAAADCTEVSSADKITILETLGPKLTKVYHRFEGRDVTQPYNDPRSFKVSTFDAANLRDVAAQLGKMHKNVKKCFIRGRFVGEDKAQPAGEPGTWTRTNGNFDDQPLHWFMVDIDGFKPKWSHPVETVPSSVMEYIEAVLPDCFKGASFYWHLSSSAGMPGKEDFLKCHVHFWSKTPYTSAQMRAWAKATSVLIDSAVYSRVQVHYTADPVFEDGRVDPVRVRAGWYQGERDDVDLIIGEATLEKAHAAGSGTGGNDMKLKDPSEKEGLIGLFHKTFDAEDVLLTLLDEFEQVSQRRYTWLEGGGTPEGVWVHDDGMHIGSSHNTWPFDGIANLWDVVRVFKFGDKDRHTDPFEQLNIDSLPVGARPSDQAMYEWAEGLPEIQEAQEEEDKEHHAAREAEIASLVARIANARSAEINGALLKEIRSIKAKGLDPGTVATIDKAIQQRLKVLSPNQAAPAIADVRRMTRPDVTKTRSTKAGPVLTVDNHYLNAHAMIGAEFTDESQRRMAVRANASWFLFNGRCYVERSEEEIRSITWPFLARTKAFSADGFPVDFNPDKACVSNVVDALKSILMARLPTPPAWLPGGDGPDPMGLIVMQNGILEITTRRLIEHTPLFFSVNELPFDFDANAQCPNWLTFLAQVFPGDAESQELLQEWFGYCLTADTSQQKMLNIVGPKRSGKGTIARVLGALVGAANNIGPTLSSLCQSFGLESWLGKLVAIFSDSRNAGKDPQIVVERILSITGEDTLTVDRKYEKAVSTQLAARITLISNELLRLGDASGALVGRLLALKTARSYFGEEDIALTAKLMVELPGILNWALVGKQRLAERGRFIQPASAAELLQATQEANDPVGTFLGDCCEFGPSYSVLQSMLFAAWQDWCGGQNRHPGNLTVFSKDFAATKPELLSTRPRGPDGKQHRTYQGLRLLTAVREALNLSLFGKL